MGNTWIRGRLSCCYATVAELSVLVSAGDVCGLYRLGRLLAGASADFSVIASPMEAEARLNFDS